MEQGSVVVDVAVDQGGCIETCRPTDHDHPTYEVHGVVHYCVPNMPGAVAQTSTWALTNTTIALRRADRQQGLVARASRPIRALALGHQHLRRPRDLRAGRAGAQAAASCRSSRALVGSSREPTLASTQEDRHHRRATASGVEVIREAQPAARALPGRGRPAARALGARPRRRALPARRDHVARRRSRSPIQRECAAVLLGALGDPRVPDSSTRATSSSGCASASTSTPTSARCGRSPIAWCRSRDARAKDVDFVVFRENTEGIYVGIGGQFKRGTPDEIAINEDVNTRKGVERIIARGLRVRRSAREDARAHGRQVERDAPRARALAARASTRSRAQYPGIEAQHLYVDALCLRAGAGSRRSSRSSSPTTCSATS